MSSEASKIMRKQYLNKRMKIQRHRVPNLLHPSHKFDEPEVSFFGKIQNSFHLLESSETKRNTTSRKYREEANIQPEKYNGKNSLKSRLKMLSEPKTVRKSLSKPDTTHNQTHFQTSKNKTMSKNMYHRPSNLQVNNIAGTNLSYQPLEHILAIKQRHEQEEFRQNVERAKSRLQEDDDQENPKQNQQKTVSIQNLQPVQHDFVQWADNIIKGQNKVYDHYEKTLMEKIKAYRKRELKMNHKSMWK